MALRKTIFGRRKNKSFKLYFKTKSTSANLFIGLTKIGISSGVTIYVKLIGMTSNYVYYDGLHTDNQFFNLSSNTTNEEVGYYLSVDNFGVTYLNLQSKNLTFVDFSRFRVYLNSENNLSGNDISSVVWGGLHNLSVSNGYNFNSNPNFALSHLPTGVVVKSLKVSGTNISDIYSLLTLYQDLTDLMFGKIGVNNFSSDIIHPKLVNITLVNATNDIPNLTLKNSSSLKSIDFGGLKVYSLTVDNCNLFENVQAWNNPIFTDFNKNGASKIKYLNITLNSFTSIIKDKLIQYCLDDNINDGTLNIGKNSKPPTNTAGLSTLQSRGWTGSSF